MLAPFTSSEVTSSDVTGQWLLRVGVPGAYVPRVPLGPDSPAFLHAVEGTAPWYVYTEPVPLVVMVGTSADADACAWFSAVLAGGVRRNPTAQRRVAGPPTSNTYLSVGRVVPADVAQHIYHPTSPLNGVRPTAGSDDVSGMGTGVGLLAILGIPSPRFLSMHFPRLILCLRRRFLEGLPTVVALGAGDAEELQAAVPGVLTTW